MSAETAGPVTTVSAPEGDTTLTLVAVGPARDAAAAIHAAWRLARPGKPMLAPEGHHHSERDLRADGRDRTGQRVRRHPSRRQHGRVQERHQIVASLAPCYQNDKVGTLRVERGAGAPRLRFTHWGSPFATRKAPDGTVTLIPTEPYEGADFGFIVGKDKDGRRTLMLPDAQHEYVYTEVR